MAEEESRVVAIEINIAEEVEHSKSGSSAGGSTAETSKSFTEDLRFHQIVVFAVTQLGYFVAVASMLSTNFFEPTKETCELLLEVNSTATSRTLALQNDFQSLLIESGEECRQSSITVFTSTAVMTGAVLGSFASGFLADRFGRKPAVVVSMLLMCLCNAMLSAISTLFWPSLLTIFFILGTACGGFVVTNMVLVVESVQSSEARFLVVTLNGWPLGMMFTAALAYLSKHWRVYHLSVAIVAFVILAMLQVLTLESVYWLSQSGNQRKTEKTKRRIEERNARFTSNSNVDISNANFTSKETVLLADSSQAQKKYGYLDLFRHKSICIPLVVLLYCFFTSSVISFGLFFSIGALPGDRYVNLVVMGAGKFLLGFIPFAASFYVGRRPIMLAASGFALFSCSCLLIVSLLGLESHWLVTALGLMIAIALDPTWKINHLYSMELFPTRVRNMSRGLCSPGLEVWQGRW